jgi:hypothetical protein
VHLPAGKAEQKADNGKNQKDDEQNFGNAHGAGGNATKAKHSSDQRNNQKHDGVVQHKSLNKSGGETRTLGRNSAFGTGSVLGRRQAVSVWQLSGVWHRLPSKQAVGQIGMRW